MERCMDEDDRCRRLGGSSPEGRLERKLANLSVHSPLASLRLSCADIRTWHSNVEQHASEGVNKILIGNKCDWSDKKVITEQQGQELAEELGLRYLETSAKTNINVEEAFFALARCVFSPSLPFPLPFFPLPPLLSSIRRRADLGPTADFHSLRSQGHQSPSNRLRASRLWSRGSRRQLCWTWGTGSPGEEWVLLSGGHGRFCVSVLSVLFAFFSSFTPYSPSRLSRGSLPLPRALPLSPRERSSPFSSSATHTFLSFVFGM